MRDFHSMLRGSVDLDYIIPPEVCVMINVVCHAEKQVFTFLSQYPECHK